MPRGGSRGSSRSPPPRSSFTNTKPMPTQQPKTQPTQTQTPSSGGMFSGIGSTIMTGMAFGAGSQVAHQAVRGLMGGSSNHGQEVQQNNNQSNQVQNNPCQMQVQAFSNCIQSNENLSYCQSYSDMLKQCKQTNNLL